MWLWSILEQIYKGFAFFIVISSFIQFRNEKTRATITLITNVITIALSIASLVYVAFWISQFSVTGRMTGRYWYGYWIYPFAYALLPQIFWIKKIRDSRLARLIVACFLLFVLYIESAIILFTSFHRDYLS